MSVRSQFTDKELEAIRSATQEAEARTGGELVCVIVDRCDSYQAPVWEAMALGTLGGAVTAGIGNWYTDLWSPPIVTWLLAPSLTGAALALLVVGLIPPVKRWMVPAEVMRKRVDRRAAAAFLEEEVFETRDRTGVLLFVALFERQIRILTDKGVDERVDPAAWQPILDRLRNGLRSDRGDLSIADAIRQCGELLVERGVTRRADDQNELANEPRLLND